MKKLIRYLIRLITIHCNFTLFSKESGIIQVIGEDLHVMFAEIQEAQNILIVVHHAPTTCVKTATQKNFLKFSLTKIMSTYYSRQHKRLEENMEDI
jgi:hypothetical protein